MIQQILPKGIVAAELFSDPPGLRAFPQEESLVSKAVEKRQKEFISTRYCARIAMTKLGIEPEPVLRGEKGVPIFPRGIVGSLTHCTGYRAAVLGYAMQSRAVGIDAEPHDALPDGVLPSVSLEVEREWISQQEDSANTVHWDRLLFCAKEATYKAWFPLTERWLGFEDAQITFDTDLTGLSGTFRSELLVGGQTIDGPPLAAFDGRWLVTRGLIIAAIVH
ncbi:MAG: 4'-phosphopantetheinyl transferase family protein [Mycobacteriaceae bacterium]